ncbi:MAG: hypothetical protein PQJ59_07100 [Spirochaetales bacterium]|nr:hypothetical protein [Spirochaetales bacterium]
MNKILFSILFLVSFVPLNLLAETVMIESVALGDRGEFEEEEKTRLIQMETGVMEALFDGGHLFFNMYSPNGTLDPMKSNNALMQARQTGARWLVRLRAQEEAVEWWFFSLADFSLLGEGNISKEDVDTGDEMTWEEVFFESGKIVGNSIVNYMNP